jgi:hypothetical protein
MRVKPRANTAGCWPGTIRQTLALRVNSPT